MTIVSQMHRQGQQDIAVSDLGFVVAVFELSFASFVLAAGAASPVTGVILESVDFLLSVFLVSVEDPIVSGFSRLD